MRALVDRSDWPVALPVEVRFSAADLVPLSPSFGRDSCQVAVYASPKHDYAPYFSAVESLLDEFGGRPHWGMLHSQTAATLARRYPLWEQFHAVRDRLDPHRVFSNDYVTTVLG